LDLLMVEFRSHLFQSAEGRSSHLRMASIWQTEAGTSFYFKSGRADCIAFGMRNTCGYVATLVFVWVTASNVWLRKQINDDVRWHLL
jgi:hypothetical protein